MPLWARRPILVKCPVCCNSLTGDGL